MTEQLVCTWCGNPGAEETETADGVLVTDLVPMLDPEGVLVLVHFTCAAELQGLAAVEAEPRQPAPAPRSDDGHEYEAWYFAAAEAVDPDRTLEPMALADAIRRHVGDDEWTRRHAAIWPTL